MQRGGVCARTRSAGEGGFVRVPSSHRSSSEDAMSDFVSGACRVPSGGIRELSHVEKVEFAQRRARRGLRSHATEEEKAATRRMTAEKDLPDTPTHTGIGGQKSLKFD